MSRILIENLGPIKSFEQDVDENLMILIGEQASGKSTIAKTIFFCKSISDEFKHYVMNQDNIIVSGHQTPFTGFIKVLRTKFVEYFGTTKHMEPFTIRYEFDNKEHVTIKLKLGYANIVFSNKLREECEYFIQKLSEYYATMSLPNDFLSGIDFASWSSQKESMNKMINHEISHIFGQDYTSIFVPAGRSMLSTNSEFFHASTPNKYDVIMNDFIERIRALQNQYSQRLEDIIEDKKKLSSINIDFERVKKATVLVRKILKGDYISDKYGEKIYYSKDKFVKLIQASSGQQEALWIVLLIFSIILNNQRVYMVIEEPEAHLFPIAQKEMLELIILMINATSSQVVITTHSPYMLSSANLLMYSSYVEGDASGNSSIIDRDYRIKANAVSSYLLSNHIAVDIMDRDTYMIKADRIDSISEDINNSLDLLLQLEERNGMQ